MIKGDCWEEVAHGLVDRSLCEVVPEDAIFKVQDLPLLNGLFSVSEDEIKDNILLARLIMNLALNHGIWWAVVWRETWEPIQRLPSWAPSTFMMKMCWSHPLRTFAVSSTCSKCPSYGDSRPRQASQRELQVVGGGFVYIGMFNRPLLSSLNQIMIVEADSKPPHARKWLRREVMVELVRFIGLCALKSFSFMDFRGKFDSMVAASDASTTGGGIARSVGLTPYGHAASLSKVRGDLPEDLELCQVLSIGLFDGIGALRVALDTIRAPVAGHISVECNPEARWVVESNFPDCEHVDAVEKVDWAMVQSCSLKYTSVGLVLVGSGPPCQGVLGLSNRKGALRDQRSRLFKHVPRIVEMTKHAFPLAQVHSWTENVASMEYDYEECEIMNQEYDQLPWFIDVDGICLAHRPRLYWVTWELQEEEEEEEEEEEGVEIFWGAGEKLSLQGQVNPKAEVSWKRDREEPPKSRFPRSQTSRPSSKPIRTAAKQKLKDGSKTNTNSLHTNTWIDIACRIAKGFFGLPAFWRGRQSTDFLPTIPFSAKRRSSMGPITDR